MPWEVRYVANHECADVRGVAVVIDVIRAFTTAAWALHLGVERVILTDDIEEALRLKAKIPGALALKDSDPHPGFELTNSPAMLQDRSDLAGRTIVQRTTAGTVGAVAARNAARLYCASFVCAAATAAAIREAGPAPVTFVVTGEDGAAGEDRACAEYIASLLEDPAADATPFLEQAAHSKGAARVTAEAAAGVGGTDARDLSFCLDANRFDFAMRARDEGGLLTLRFDHL